MARHPSRRDPSRQIASTVVRAEHCAAARAWRAPLVPVRCVRSGDEYVLSVEEPLGLLEEALFLLAWRVAAASPQGVTAPRHRPQVFDPMVNGRYAEYSTTDIGKAALDGTATLADLAAHAEQARASPWPPRDSCHATATVRSRRAQPPTLAALTGGRA